jgi:hypothetical protein
MAIWYAGDIHGTTNIANITIAAENRGVDYIVQVGDFGLFWPSKNASKKFFRDQGKYLRWDSSWLDQWIQKRAKKGWKTEILTCGGNHDNWNALYELWEEQGKPNKVELYPDSGVYWIPRGAALDLNGISHLFIGGAESSDKEHRTPNLTWWDKEEPSLREFNLFTRTMEDIKPDTIVSHDAPLRVQLYRVRRKSGLTPNMLERAIKNSGHEPKRWYFGHHHKLQKWKILGTKFYCCGLHGQYWERN